MQSFNLNLKKCMNKQFTGIKMNKYLLHLISSVRRKKSSMLIIAFLLILIIFGIHYNRDVEPIVGQIFPKLLKETMDSSRVNFLSKNESSDNLNVDEYSQDKHERILAKDENFLNYLDSVKNIASMETEQNLGIPFVNSYIKNPYIPRKRLVHLDLKGAPPLISYYRRFFPFIKNLGATGILIEYEDMFPYDGVLRNMSAKNSYTKVQIAEILNLAEESHLEVIPLIQTFGHLEFALKLQDFRNLREVPDSPQALCPKRNGSLEFIKEMVNQVMALHPKIKYLHIGCDEVFQMAECELCRLELRETLFLRHVQNVSTMILKNFPSLKLIIWDDMLRHISQQTILDMNLGALVEPMIWVYAEDIYRFVQPLIWSKYSAIFPRVWAASAFKGAFGESLYVPDAKRHLENNLRWLDLMSHQAEDFRGGFVGLVLTGWQRYDHFAILCETLPAAVPSLALSLTAVTYGYFNASLKSIFLSALSCPRENSVSPFISLEYDPFLWDKLGRCLFPGSHIFRLVHKLNAAESETKDFVKQTKEQKGWLTDYNSRRKFSSPLRIEEIVSELPRLYHNMLSLVRNSFEAMEGVFDNFTITEWIEQRIYPYILQLEKIEKESTAIKSSKIWPARPLPILPELKRIIEGLRTY
ncbi:hexosaminidase D-like [Coccinella septempunctata]|uniref:hexosaminidase D-like n=1 Tax=Coccinella septempunctata TaxID=41139 RepID=UPI001D08D426|nr:hexosaminidase D-like [Coccinella septempunctata]